MQIFFIQAIKKAAGKSQLFLVAASLTHIAAF
jgi:hypothetical protein